MTTSGVTTFAVNRDQIIRMAMLNIGKLEQSEVPTPQEISDCAMFLNSMVKQWQGKADFAPGLKTWTRRHGHLFLRSTTSQYLLGPGGTGWCLNYVSTSTTAAAAAGQPNVVVASATGITIGDNFGVEVASGDMFWSTVQNVVGTTVTLATNLPTGGVLTNAIVFDYTTVAPQPIEIESVFLRDSTGNDTPMKIMTVAEYDSLPAKAAPTNLSDPAAIYYEFQLTNGVLYTDVFGASDVTKHICLTFMQAEEDFVSASDTPYYPQEWYLALALNLSKLICPMFNAVWTKVMDDNAKLALAIAQKKEPEKVVMFFQAGEISG